MNTIPRNNIPRHIGTVLRELRIKRRYSQKEFAAILGLGRSYLSEIETGKKDPSVDQLRNISDRLSIPLPILYLKTLTEEDLSKYVSKVNKTETIERIRTSISEIESHFTLQFDTAELSE